MRADGSVGQIAGAGDHRHRRGAQAVGLGDGLLEADPGAGPAAGGDQGEIEAVPVGRDAGRRFGVGVPAEGPGDQQQRIRVVGVQVGDRPRRARRDRVRLGGGEGLRPDRVHAAEAADPATRSTFSTHQVKSAKSPKIAAEAIAAS